MNERWDGCDYMQREKPLKLNLSVTVAVELKQYFNITYHKVGDKRRTPSLALSKFKIMRNRNVKTGVQGSKPNSTTIKLWK